MKRYLKELCLIGLLLIILIIIGILIYTKKETLKKNYESFDLVGTKWNMNKIEKYENSTMSIITTYENIVIDFMKDFVSICAFYEDTSTCSMNQYSRVDNTYIVAKGDFLDIQGTVTFDKNGNINLEQELDNNSKIIYYFVKEG